MASILSSKAAGQEPADRTHPEGEELTPVVLDGVFGLDEWRDATEVYADDACSVLIKRSAVTIYVGIRCPAIVAPMVDLFVQFESGSVYQLHASSFLDERMVVDGELTESPWHSHLNLDWAANRLRWDRNVRDSLTAIGVRGAEMLRHAVVPLDGIEYQIRASRLGNCPWLFRFEVSDFGKDNMPFLLPPDTNLESTHDWLRVDASSVDDRSTQNPRASEHCAGPSHGDDPVGTGGS